MNPRSLFTLIVQLIFVSVLSAQSIGSIQGKLVDKTTKQPLIGANVLVMENDNKPTTFGSTTDEYGVYSIKSIPENIYKLKMTYIGYNTHIEPDIRVIRGKTFYVKEIEIAELPVEGEEVIVSSGYFINEKDMPVWSYGIRVKRLFALPGLWAIFSVLSNLCPEFQQAAVSFQLFLFEATHLKTISFLSITFRLAMYRIFPKSAAIWKFKVDASAFFHKV